MSTRKGKAPLEAAEQAIASWAAAYPEVVEEAPWGHRAFKVRGKTFLFLSNEDNTLGFSVKLPHSGLDVLGLPFAEPTHYGLGKSGWVSCTFGATDPIPLEMVEEWLRESFVAIAPKRLSAQLSLKAEPQPKQPKPPARTMTRRAKATV